MCVFSSFFSIEIHNEEIVHITEVRGGLQCIFSYTWMFVPIGGGGGVL